MMNKQSALNIIAREAKKLHPTAEVRNNGRYVTIKINGEFSEDEYDALDAISDSDELGEVEIMESQSPEPGVYLIGYNVPE